MYDRIHHQLMLWSCSVSPEIVLFGLVWLECPTLNTCKNFFIEMINHYQQSFQLFSAKLGACKKHQLTKLTKFDWFPQNRT